VFLLAKVDCVSLEELFALAGEDQSDVAEEAQAAIVGRAQENPEVLQEVFSAINQGSVALLNANALGSFAGTSSIQRSDCKSPSHQFVERWLGES
jgi:hypothetical protein